MYTYMSGNLNVLAGRLAPIPCQRMLPIKARSGAELLKSMLKDSLFGLSKGSAQTNFTPCAILVLLQDQTFHKNE